MSSRLVTYNPLRGLLYREAVRRGAARLPYAPFTVYLDPANACNLRCTFCPQSDWHGGRRGRMAWGTFEHVLPQVAALKPDWLFLFCFGEPLLQDRLGEMVRAAGDAGLRVRIHTNGLLMTGEVAEQLVEAGLAECRFSFDTADRALYERMRNGADFDEATEGIRTLVAARDRLGRPRPEVVLQELVPYEPGASPENTQAYRDLFRGLDVRLRAKFMHSFAGQGRETEFAGQQAEGRSYCSQLYRRIVVNFDGKVHACCLDPFGHNVVGDLLRGDTLAEAWNSPAMQDLRDRTNRGDVSGLAPCDGCEMLARPAHRGSPAKALLARLAWACLAG